MPHVRHGSRDVVDWPRQNVDRATTGGQGSMNRNRTWRIARAGMLAVCAPFLATGGAMARDSGDATVYRGSEADVVTFATKAAPSVVRGKGAVHPEAAAEPNLALPSPLAVVAGRTAWIVNTGSGKVVACGTKPGLYVGQRFLHCTAGRLP